MVNVYSGPSMGGLVSVSRPMVKVLFVASCLLSIVSWYTTYGGMALYLSTWFSIMASLGVQISLVIVAWLIGFTPGRKSLLISVYAITAIISIAFSYVSLYTWFSARERPATVQRRLYDSLSAAAGQSQKILADAISEGNRHVLALEEMTTAEKAHGYISRAQDSDPYLARIREAVALEAQTYSTRYPEGAGAGLRYTAFERHAKLARQSVARLEEAQRALAEFGAQLKPLEPTENQIRAFRLAFDSVPWNEVEETLHAKKFELPTVPSYTDYVDSSATGQEDLLLAFQEIVSAPTSRHAFALILAAFIDLIVFLLAYASGPYFFGSPEARWLSSAAAIDSSDSQVFARNLLRKLSPAAQGMARAEVASLSPGELQFCVMLAAKGLAVCLEQEGKRYYLIDPSIHEQIFDSLSSQGLAFRAASAN
jgi:hypothetical protein